MLIRFDFNTAYKMYRASILLYLICPVIYASPSVIIVGAGPAGVAAAAKLVENGITDVKVLEAEDRIGGRINSVKFGDAFVDLGAEFCHGQKDNIVYNMVKDLDPEILQKSPAKISTIAFSSKGEEIDSALFEDIGSFCIMDIEEIAEKYNVELEKNAETTSLGDYLLNLYNNTIMKKYKGDDEKLKVLEDAKRFVEKYYLSQEGAFDWYKPSASGHHEHSPGDQMMTWKGHGFKIVLDILMKAYPNPKEKLNIEFLLNKEVSEIDWSENKISIECKDHSKYTADHVIFTPSVGVLKAQHAELFNPQLPVPKQDAINGIGFDGLMKIVLHFPHNWWGNNTFLSFIWSPEDLAKSGQEFSQGTVKDGLSWITQINAVAKSANNSNVLIAWVSGPWVPEIEQLPTETLKEGIWFLIKKFMGNKYKVIEPDQLIHSSWCTNPHFRGTYSYETPESHKKGLWNQKEYLKPLNNANGIPTIMFAGEATHPVHYATVHGAIESGQREANRILDLYKASN